MESFEDKQRRDFVERFGATKGNRVADEVGGKPRKRSKKERKGEPEQE